MCLLFLVGIGFLWFFSLSETGDLQIEPAIFFSQREGELQDHHLHLVVIHTMIYPPLWLVETYLHVWSYVAMCFELLNMKFAGPGNHQPCKKKTGCTINLPFAGCDEFRREYIGISRLHKILTSKLCPSKKVEGFFRKRSAFIGNGELSNLKLKDWESWPQAESRLESPGKKVGSVFVSFFPLPDKLEALFFLGWKNRWIAVAIWFESLGDGFGSNPLTQWHCVAVSNEEFSSWWFHIYLFIFTPDPWGRFSPILTVAYFSFRGWWKTTNELSWDFPILKKMVPPSSFLVTRNPHPGRKPKNPREIGGFKKPAQKKDIWSGKKPYSIVV